MWLWENLKGSIKGGNGNQKPADRGRSFGYRGAEETMVADVTPSRGWVERSRVLSWGTDSNSVVVGGGDLVVGLKPERRGGGVGGKVRHRRGKSGGAGLRGTKVWRQFCTVSLANRGTLSFGGSGEGQVGKQNKRWLVGFTKKEREGKAAFGEFIH